MTDVVLNEHGRIRRADAYGVSHYPVVLREPLIALKMMRETGLRATLGHIRIIALIRLLNRFDDNARMRAFPARLSDATNASADQARIADPQELAEAVHCAPIPATALTWTLGALDLDPRAHHFVDVGSGWGYALGIAAQYPFRKLTGIEFAGEFHKMACTNMDALAAAGSLDRTRVELRHESALESELPQEPLVLLLANPFGPAVMRPFIERVAQSHRDNPRPITVIYVNPKHADLFERSDVEELALKGTDAWKLRLFGPYAVRAYRWR
ncbi:MAG: hypothetical protein JJU21_15575 [Salinarimonas sp.]|nr:hypothetical protein [Salinarimonas sp.]